MSISFDKALGILPQMSSFRTKRAEILASNIANADTPNYKAKDLEFKDSFNNALKKNSFRMLKTDQQHLSHAGFNGSEYSTQYRSALQNDTGDGNTVDLQKERSEFIENALAYQMSVRFLGDKFNSLRKAIKGE